MQPLPLLGLLLASCFVAQAFKPPSSSFGSAAACDSAFDRISAVCCSGGGRRQLAELPSLLTCSSKSCSAACGAVLPRYYAACKGAMKIPAGWGSFCSSTAGNPAWKACNYGGACDLRTWGSLNATCTYNYQAGRFTSLRLAQKKCLKTRGCSGVYKTNCHTDHGPFVGGRRSTQFYLCKGREYFRKSSYTCVFHNPQVSIVAKPADSCASNPCQHGGKCRSYINIQPKAHSIYSCQCPRGPRTPASLRYYGSHCQTKWVDACSSSPCLNGATCVSNTYSPSYSCKCASNKAAGVVFGYKNCGTKIDDPCDGGNAVHTSPCENGATCSASGNTYSKVASYTCTCASGWKGRYCDLKVTPKSDVCPGSGLQTCKMICPDFTCPTGSCVKRLGGCCHRVCQKVHCAAADCCYSGGHNNYCACKGSAQCRLGCQRRGLQAIPVDACGPSCTAAETKAGMKHVTCGTACPLTCGKQIARMCTRQCLIGCQCPRGLFVDHKQGGKCVTEAKCTDAPIKIGIHPVDPLPPSPPLNGR